MPGQTSNGLNKPKKRHHDGDEREEKRSKKSKRPGNSGREDEQLDQQSRILLLESRIVESRKHYNDIVKLLELFTNHTREEEEEVLAASAVSLCRVFSRLMASGALSKSSKTTAESEAMIVQWLRERYREYTEGLRGCLQDGDLGTTALTLLMRCVRDEGVHLKQDGHAKIPTRLLSDVIRTVLEVNMAVEEYGEKYMSEYDDVRYSTYAILNDVIPELDAKGRSNALKLLSSVEESPSSQEDLESFYIKPESTKKNPLHSLTAHKKQAQKAWLALLRSPLDNQQRKTILGLISHSVAPWFLNVELLMDFLTDSYNVGGSTSLLALSGLFYLMQEKNLDYPLFYTKLYSLLDARILHSRHRSRFFRLLDTFLGSTHLPATLVASFIKRLARLTLFAPPAGIVVVIPWVYNLLKRHPTCTFMIHRELSPDQLDDIVEDGGLDDPFNMHETDPTQTAAIDSSLWELYMLQSHFHPNVATLAKIISEQFTKQSYNLEDFLDHSYASMIDAELGRDIKKVPVVEYEIPKRIFTTHDPSAGVDDNLLVKLWDFS